jgi:predicted esterase
MPFLQSCRFAIAASLLVVGGLCAQDTAKQKLAQGEVLIRSHHMQEAKRDIEYALYVSSKCDRQKAAPMVVLLHGLGSNPRQVIGYRGIVSEAESRGYVVVAPYGFNERGWYGSRGKGKEGPFFGLKSDPDNLGELSEKDVFQVIGIVEGELRIDDKRRFLMGHSMGGAGSVYLGATRNEMWAGLALLAPALGGPMDLLKQLTAKPVYVVMGDKDRMVPVATVRQWVEEMKRLEVPTQYEEIPGGDHVQVISQNEQMIARVFDFFDAAPQQAKVKAVEDAKKPAATKGAPKRSAAEAPKKD